jgi:leucyl aminopeptidase
VLIGVAVTSAELDSDVADLKNRGGVDAGASSVGQFLARFAEDTPACSSTTSNDSTDR